MKPAWTWCLNIIQHCKDVNTPQIILYSQRNHSVPNFIVCLCRTWQMVLSLYKNLKAEVEHLRREDDEEFALLDIKILNKIKPLLTWVLGPAKGK